MGARGEIPLPRPGMTRPAGPITLSRIWVTKARSHLSLFFFLTLLPRQQHTEIMLPRGFLT